MGLRTYIIRRLLLMIPTLIGVVLLVFAVSQLFSPEQRASLYARSERDASSENIQNLINKYHLSDALWVQFYYWALELLQGNLGWSQSAMMPVVQAISSAIPATFELVILVIPITVFLGIYLGVISATHRDKLLDHVTRTASIIGWSLPTFWLAIILLAVFYGGLGWFPPHRLDSITNAYVRSSEFIKYTGVYSIDGILNGQLWVTADALKHIVLPVITLVTIQIAIIVRVMRSSMLEALSKGYITAARAKGLSQKEVINKHARRNALMPVITISGLLAAGMLSGVVITETVFNYRGLGYLAAHAAVRIDIPMVIGFALFSGVLIIVANLLVDIAYALVDPRIRLG